VALASLTKLGTRPAARLATTSTARRIALTLTRGIERGQGRDRRQPLSVSAAAITRLHNKAGVGRCVVVTKSRLGDPAGEPDCSHQLHPWGQAVCHPSDTDLSRFAGKSCHEIGTLSEDPRSLARKGGILHVVATDDAAEAA
jgi:hypothetical protein